MNDIPISQGISPPSPDVLSNAIGTLMANPQLLSNIKKAIENSGLIAPQNEPEDTEDKNITSDKTDDNDNTKSEPVGQNLFSSIPPEIINKLPLIMSLLGGGTQSAPKSKKEAEREALLCALKPYLTREKVETIDKIIQISRLGDIFKLL